MFSELKQSSSLEAAAFCLLAGTNRLRQALGLLLQGLNWVIRGLPGPPPAPGPKLQSGSFLINSTHLIQALN